MSNLLDQCNQIAAETGPQLCTLHLDGRIQATAQMPDFRLSERCESRHAELMTGTRPEVRFPYPALSFPIPFLISVLPLVIGAYAQRL